MYSLNDVYKVMFQKVLVKKNCLHKLSKVYDNLYMEINCKGSYLLLLYFVKTNQLKLLIF